VYYYGVPLAFLAPSHLQGTSRPMPWRVEVEEELKKYSRSEL